MRCLGSESAGRPLQQPELERDHLAIIHPILRKGRQVFQVIRFQQSPFQKRLQIDQQRIAGEGREALIRRIAVAGRPQGQHLPQRLPAGGQEIDELVRARPQIADAETARQRRGVQQDATCTGEHHGLSLISCNSQSGRRRDAVCAPSLASTRLQIAHSSHARTFSAASSRPSRSYNATSRIRIEYTAPGLGHNGMAFSKHRTACSNCSRRM